MIFSRIRTPIERAIVYPTVGALAGAWSGTIPIGLDWERPWQVSETLSANGCVAYGVVGVAVDTCMGCSRRLCRWIPPGSICHQPQGDCGTRCTCQSRRRASTASSAEEKIQEKDRLSEKLHYLIVKLTHSCKTIFTFA